MNNLEIRKAQLREYIEAYKFALNGVYEDDNGNGESENIDRWLTWEIKAANESARIAEQLLECIETLQHTWPGEYGTVVNQFNKKALNKIAGEKCT